MKERLAILLGVLAAAWLVWGIFVPRLSPDTTSRPLSTEAGPGGLLGLQRWLEQGGVPTRSLREPFTSLTAPGGPFARSGNVLVTVMPHYELPDRDDMNSLLDWVSEGNTLVILAGLNDTPAWTPAVDTTTFVDDFGYLTSLRATFRRTAGAGDDDEEDEDDDADANPAVPADPRREFTLDALPGHWLTDDVLHLAAVSDLLTGPWDIEPDPGAPAFVIARVPGEDIDALLVTNLGKGALVISTFASLWQNSVIGQEDNRQLALNLLAHHLKPGSTVIFDDFHHGLTSTYDARAFFSDPRLAWTCVLLLGFWLLYAVFADSRLGSPAEPEGAPSHTDFARVLGNFLARKVSRRDVGLRLVENFLAHVRPHVDGGPEAAIWERIVAAPRMDAALAESLRRDHAELLDGRTVDIQKLQHRLSAARRAFS